MQLPALIEGMSFPAYLADPADRPSVTSSIIRKLLETAPRAVWEDNRRLNPEYEEKEERKFDLGKAAHAQWVGEGEPIVVIEADSFRSAAARAERDEAYLVGHTPVLAKEMDRVCAMADEAAEFFGAHPGTGPHIGRAKREASLFWREAAVTCRCRPDFFALGAELGDPPIIIHYKSTGTTINPHGLARFAANQGWDMIAAHYHAGVLALTGKASTQLFAIQENIPPYLGIVAELDHAFVATAEMRRQRAMHIWARCLDTGNWPRHANMTIKLSPPPWHENALIEQKDQEESFRLASGQDPFDVMQVWQAPQPKE